MNRTLKEKSNRSNRWLSELGKVEARSNRSMKGILEYMNRKVDHFAYCYALEAICGGMVK